MPTGSDLTGALPFFTVNYRVHNDAVHLLPFLALTATRSDAFFYHAFAQIDIATNGNRVEAANGIGSTESGVVNDQTLTYLDLGAGYWLHRNPCSDYLTGVAAVAELHYTTTLQDPDSVSLFGGVLDFGNAAGRFNVLNVTAGIHVEVTEQTHLRFGGVFPLGEDNDRFFDSEIQASLIRRF